MQALFDTPRGHRVILCMPLRDFMASRLMRDQATVAMCTPGELVLAHLPAEPAALDAEDFAPALTEACEAATEFSVSHVTLDDRDLRYARRLLRDSAAAGGTGPSAA